jgi:hypothetical protein
LRYLRGREKKLLVLDDEPQILADAPEENMFNRSSRIAPSKKSFWYILRRGTKLELANLTPGEALRCEEQGYWLAERICDSRAEGAAYLTALQNRARQFSQSHQRLQADLQLTLQGKGFAQITEQALSTSASAIARRLDLNLAASMLNGSSLRELYQVDSAY